MMAAVAQPRHLANSGVVSTAASCTAARCSRLLLSLDGYKTLEKVKRRAVQ